MRVARHAGAAHATIETPTSTSGTTRKLSAFSSRFHRERLREEERRHQPHDQTAGGDHQRLAADQREDVAAPCAERRPQTDFASALRGRVPQHAEEPHAGDRQRAQREPDEKHRVAARPRQARRHAVLHRHDRIDRERGILGANERAGFSGEGGRILWAANDDDQVLDRKRPLPMRHEDLRL